MFSEDDFPNIRKIEEVSSSFDKLLKVRQKKFDLEEIRSKPELEKT